MLTRALDVASAAMSELGGGPGRVEQRLRTTLAWCRDESYPGLMLDSSLDQIARSWMFRNPDSSPDPSAFAHHRAHARRIQWIAHEIRLPRSLRTGLVKTAQRLAASAQRLARQNASNKRNRQLAAQGAGFRVDWDKSDSSRQSQRIEAMSRKRSQQLIDLQRSGWIVVFETLVLPSHIRPSLKRWRCWGLAGSPDSAQGRQALQDMSKAARPKENSSRRLGGLWCLQSHACEQLHQHAVIAFRDQQEYDDYRKQLEDAYSSETYRWRKLTVLGGFGIGIDVEENAIVMLPLATPDDIRREVQYILRELDVEADLIPGNRHGTFGALAAPKPKVKHDTTPEPSIEAEHHDDDLAAPKPQLMHSTALEPSAEAERHDDDPAPSRLQADPDLIPWQRYSPPTSAFAALCALPMLALILSLITTSLSALCAMMVLITTSLSEQTVCSGVERIRHYSTQAPRAFPCLSIPVQSTSLLLPPIRAPPTAHESPISIHPSTQNPASEDGVRPFVLGPYSPYGAAAAPQPISR